MLTHSSCCPTSSQSTAVILVSHGRAGSFHSKIQRRYKSGQLTLCLISLDGYIYPTRSICLPRKDELYTTSFGLKSGSDIIIPGHTLNVPIEQRRRLYLGKFTRVENGDSFAVISNHTCSIFTGSGVLSLQNGKSNSQGQCHWLTN